MKSIQDLIDISRYYGSQKDFTLAGGGNTSYKNEKFIWVKASGMALGTITRDGFVMLDRSKVNQIGKKEYSSDPHIREREVKEDLTACKVDATDLKRPSVETSIHNLINYAFVVHLHPTIINSVTCSVNAEKTIRELFGEEIMYIGYAAGYELFKSIQSKVKIYRDTHKKDPSVLFLQNHGIFVAAESIDEIKNIYSFLIQTIKNKLKSEIVIEEIPVKSDILKILPAIRMILSEERTKILKLRRDTLTEHFCKDELSFKKVSLPFTPDIIVYCKGRYLYINDTSSPDSMIESFKIQLADFIQLHGYKPSIILIKDYGVLAVGDSAEDTEITLDVYSDLLKISFYSESFGGPHFMSDDDISFIDNWEVENYRRQVSKGDSSKSIVDQKVVIITGGAQGFGEGIAEELVKNNSNVIIADLNEKAGNDTFRRLNQFTSKNQVVFIKADVSVPESVQSLIEKTVRLFGGLDILISNAGILKAGGLDEMDPLTFAHITRVNYEGYFLTVKYASEVMALQFSFNSKFFYDIIQINSKSGLRGSNKNFAYSGGKFGGIGLTQSFALELAPYRIKVNSICPGNFFEGPLWTDPVNGLFVQYLKAGKVEGATTLDDVKRYYERQVPMGRGCLVKDVMKAIYYVISQEYETGQAVPVTGGQVMLG